MEKAASPNGGGGGSHEQLQCVGRMEIVKPQPAGFLCGSIPVSTDASFHDFNSALVPSTPQKVSGPQYRVIPTETDLNTLPLLPNIPDKVLPLSAVHSRTGVDLPYGGGSLTSNLSRKGEALAVSGFAEYGDEIDVIAPADILKQIFKIPYSKSRLSIAVRRIGQTLILNSGPDVEEGEKLVRRHNNQSQSAEKSMLLNFAMHSVRMEACDCPTAHTTSMEQSSSSVLPGRFESREGSSDSSEHTAQKYTSHHFAQCNNVAQEDGFNQSDCPQVKDDTFFWGSKNNKRNKGHHAVKKVSQVKDQPRSSVQESDKHRRVSNDGFLRVLFWQFHNFRMLLGSDMLIFSNEKYIAVSLHLWDVSRQVTPLTWLEAWLDNIMASVPELAICYHQDGVVQGYELLKTDDIFLSKGISEDGTPAFHPHVVQQNGHSVMRFLHENCKQDPGAYWLYKSAGEDAIQLFDLSVIRKDHSSTNCDDSSSSLPSLVNRGRSNSLPSLGTLLYRIAHRLSLSVSSQNRARCTRFFRKCLDFLDEPDNLVVRAFAHEQFARLLLSYDDEWDLVSEEIPVESKVTFANAEEESFEIFSGDVPCRDAETFHDHGSQHSLKMCLEANISASRVLTASNETDSNCAGLIPSSSDQSLVVCETSTGSAPIVQTIVDPISSKEAAIHHVSQAIKSLRWKRQLQSSESDLDCGGRTQDRPTSSMDFSVCACGDVDCIEVCDIRQWLPTSKLDDKLWKLVLLLGESYLALGEAYMDDDQLHQALKIVELACLVYGSMPQHLEDTRFISSLVDDATKRNSDRANGPFTLERFPSTYLFWAKAWTLVGDVYVKFHIVKGKEISVQTERKPCDRELKMSSEVLKEVKRLKKKLGHFSQSCIACSLVNCSCQSDRASSGSSASSSGNTRPLGHGRKQGKKSYAKGISSMKFANPEELHVHQKGEDITSSELAHLKHNTIDTLEETFGKGTDAGKKSWAASQSLRVECPMEMHNLEFTVAATAPREAKEKSGGIFKYLRGSMTEDADFNLSTALSCYEEARTALGGQPTGSLELQSVAKKKGWVCNELGRNRLARKELDKAELAFVQAVTSFKEVSDHVNIILINCNLGHGRRALAEEMVSKIEGLKKHEIFQNVYNQALETAKVEYSEALMYYGAAKAELNAVAEEADSVPINLRDEVYTQFAHTYLRLGMFLARENTTAEVFAVLEDCTSPSVRRAKKELTKHEISANDAIREAIDVYEKTLGEVRKQEAAYAYFQLSCYQRDCCLRFLESDQKKSNLSKRENSVLQRVKQYASLAERNWQKCIEFYGPKTHPMMFLTILIERSALSLTLSSPFHSTTMLESALTGLFEGRHISKEMIPDASGNEVHKKFWSQLQVLLKRMLSATLATNATRSSVNHQQTSSNRSGDVGKLKELYRMSLKSNPDFSQLHAMHSLWIS
ncbi:hypothetical protein RJ639_007529 [Escallonia herrerae]|uniref:EDRF1 N-terminal domain-containing protein n=1 Tax=Escallonia herrerae TaxID=1293975 RepID=A0AA88VYY8_9ASTE|nr:hypothetical protein RJ639_007529 [Escallonia herrerae]